MVIVSGEWASESIIQPNESERVEFDNQGAISVPVRARARYNHYSVTAAGKFIFVCLQALDFYC